ncbi:tetratricopeptide repeat protein [Piscinibacter sakaiensis]|uniref:tetratricopeptide repeat protein n=1 Tax=Piscinibacter sakaiensis TaxID=1547922 RepID=UPI003AAD473C
MEISNELQTAIDHHRHGRIDRAREGYDAVLTAEPDNVHALSVSAILLSQLGDDNTAIKRLQRAIELEPRNASLHNNLGNIFRRRDREEEAFEAYRTAILADPQHVDSICNLAVMVRARGAIDDALAIFGQALAVDPDHVESNHNLGVTLSLLGRNEEAADCFERCYSGGRLPVVDPSWHAQTLDHLGRHQRAVEILEAHAAARPDDAVAKHYLAAIRGERLQRASNAYVREHFDVFAQNFDEVLARLKYKGPEIVAGIVNEMCERGPAGMLYDLGCGTGLLGPRIRQSAKVLIGVDLSPRMLERAGRRKVYDELIVCEITDALTQIPQHSVDMAVAVDTLIYFGDLAPIFAGLHRSLKTGGAFIATVESHADDDPAGGSKILPSGRFSHSAAYIRETAAANGLKPHALLPIELRLEHGEPVTGLVFMLENLA